MALNRLSIFLITVFLFPTTYNVSAQSMVCGQRRLVDRTEGSRIVGGHNAPVGAWPWQVSVQMNSRHYCGGTIIDSLWVLTASHCFNETPKHNRLRVVAGLNVLSAPGRHSQYRYVDQIRTHDKFIKTGFHHDVALLRLSSPLELNNYVQPICTVNNVTHESNLNLSQCYITGWGSRHYKGSAIDRLQEAMVELIDRGTCNRIDWYNGFITVHMMCAGSDTGAVDACQGDSGGPLQCYSDYQQRFYIIGVTSFGEECGLPKRPGVYTRLSQYASWLSTTQDRSLSAAFELEPRLLSIISVMSLAVWLLI